MATFNTDGVGELLMSMTKLSKLPDGVVMDMLHAGGDVIKKGHEQKIKSLFTAHSHNLENSVKVLDKRRDAGKYVLIYPAGTHHTYHARMRWYKKSVDYGRNKETRATQGGLATASNSEVGFVLEFGAPGRHISGRNWMQTANEEHIEEAVGAEEEVLNRFISAQSL